MGERWGTCLNFCDASSLPAFRSGCHFNACNLRILGARDRKEKEYSPFFCMLS